MRVRRGKLALVLAAGLSVVAAMSGSAATGDDTAGSVSRFARIDASLLETSGQPAFVPASLSNQQVSAVLQMAGDPVAVQDANARKRGGSLSENDKQAIRQQLQAKQDALHDRLAAAGADVIGQMQDAYNGIQVSVAQKDLAQLASLPGVTAIHAVPAYDVDNVNGVPFIGAPQAWGNFSLTGDGVNVAVIDTGIDYTHADFGGPGTVAAWNAAKATSTAAPDASLVGPNAPKVKGGFDFVGDAYNANVPGSKPMPDPNPLDCFGHGSHTAGTLAGFGVLNDGSTFKGTYDANTIKSNTWNVGPGVAPKANLYIYRVFGCAGSSEVVDLGIDAAVKAHVSVISMSLGSPFGGFSDPTSVAAQNAFDDGIAVITSAGNNGTNGYLVGSPSTANGILSVAAIDGSVPTYPGAQLNLSTGATVKAIDANGASLPSGSFQVKVLRNPDGSIALGCNKTDYAGTAGMVVVTARGSCARVARAVFGDEAGDAAVVMVNNSAGLPPFEGQITSDPDTGEQHTVTIPFLGVDNSAATVSALKAADGGTTTLTSITVPNANYKRAAAFTSGGPRNPDSAPKPDVMAPGVSVASVGMGTGNLPTVMSGTSMACPMTAGIAALLKQEHPDWTGVQIKAAIMNTADPSLNLNYNSRVAGTGVVQAQNAVNSSVLATTSENLDSIAFGQIAGSSDYHADKTFTLTNVGSTNATYDLAVVLSPGTGSLGSSIAVSPKTVAVAVGASVTVHATLDMTAPAFAALPSDDTFSTGLGAVRSVRGDIVATRDATDTATDHQTLRLPFMFVPRGLSNVVAGKPGPFVATATTTDGQDYSAGVTITNSGIHSGSADLFTWGITDPNDVPGASMDVRDVGLQVQPGAAFGEPDTDRGLVFLINTWTPATNQAKNEYDISIDTNGDGKPDFIVVGADIGNVLSGSFDGRFGSFTFDVASGKLVGPIFAADAPMNGTTIELPTLASDLGLSPKNHGIGSPGKQGITYTVTAFSKVPGGLVDQTGSASIDPYAPSVSSGDSATIPSGGSTTFTLTEHMPQQARQPALGWLVASVDDAAGPAQADEVAAAKPS